MSIILSIIIPIYNAEKYLEKCLNSVLNQTFQDFECLLINDGSTDSSYLICNEYLKKDKRIKVFHTKNYGVSSARNLGIEKSSGKYITFIDSDDWIDNNTYFNAINYLENNDYDIFCFNFESCFENGIKKQNNFKNKSVVTNFIRYPAYMNSVCNKVIKKELFTENSIYFNTELSTAEDLDVIFKIILFSKKIFFSDKIFYNYRVNPNSATNSKLTQKKIDDTYFVYIDLLNFCKNRNVYKKYKKFLLFWNAVSVLPLLTKEHLFNTKLFRERIVFFNFWTFTFNPIYFFLFLFACLHLDFLCKFFIKIKKLIKHI